MDPVSITAATVAFLTFGAQVINLVKDYKDAERLLLEDTREWEKICADFRSISANDPGISTLNARQVSITSIQNLADEIWSLGNQVITWKSRAGRGLDKPVKAWKALQASKDIKRLEQRFQTHQATLSFFVFEQKSKEQNQRLSEMERLLKGSQNDNRALQTQLNTIDQTLNHLRTGLDQNPTNNDLLKQLLLLERRTENADDMMIIMRTLAGTVPNERESQIDDASQGTYEWLIDSTQSPFRDWLVSRPTNRSNQAKQNNIFLISGKPGSGKSTLMKFLFTHDRTTDILQHVAGNRKVVLARFYFKLHGKEEQRQLDSMFKSVLFQILGQCPDLATSVIPSRLRRLGSNMFTWKMQDLIDALKKILVDTDNGFHCCIFIDALDEYSGTEYDARFRSLLDFFDMLSQSPWVHVIISSRPRRTLEERYGRNERNVVHMHEVTQNDIKRYLHTVLLDDRDFQHFFRPKGSPQNEHLLEMIQAQAGGVFLWVTIVANRVRNRILRRHPAREIETEIERLPDELGDLFGYCLNTANEYDTVVAARAFLICLESEKTLPAFLMTPLRDEISSDPQSFPAIVFDDVGPCKGDKFPWGEGARDLDMEIQTWTANLLSVKCVDLEAKFGHSHTMLSYKVDFIHRTAREWLLERKETLRRVAGRNFDAKISLCFLYTKLARSLGYMSVREGPWISTFFEVSSEAFVWASKCQADSGRVPYGCFAAIEEAGTKYKVALERTELERLASNNDQAGKEAKKRLQQEIRPEQLRHWTSKGSNPSSPFGGLEANIPENEYSIEALCVSYGLVQDIRAALKAGNFKRSGLNYEVLLDCCVAYNFISLDRSRGPIVDLAVDLLKEGANPNAKLQDLPWSKSVWERFLGINVYIPTSASSQDEISHFRSAVLALTDAMLDFGADPTVDWRELIRNGDVDPRSAAEFANLFTERLRTMPQRPKLTTGRC